MVLPKLNTERIEAMQHEVMGGVARVQQKRRRKTQLVTGGFALVAVLSVATLIGNGSIGGGADGLRFSLNSTVGTADMSAPSPVAPEMAIPGETSYDGANRSTAEQTAASAREIIRTAQLGLISGDIAAAMNSVGELTRNYEGYVEQLSQRGLQEYRNGADTPTYSDGRDIAPYYPYYGGENYMVLRVPANQLDAFLAELDAVGTVESLVVQQVDVTADVQDLDARITTLQLSIERLQGLLSSATTTADLIAAETQLTERQSQLESLESTRERYSSQVAMSQVNIQFSGAPKPAELAPDGFWGGLLTGWNSVVAALSGMIVGLGVILPWLGVIVVFWLLVWGIVRIRRGSNRA